MDTGADPLTGFVELLAEYDPRAADAVRLSQRARGANNPPLRLLRESLGELLAGREHRADAAAQRAEALRLRHRELAEQVPVLARQWPTRLHEALAEVRLAVTSDAAEAVRRLHDDARHEVEHGDRDVHDGFPPRLAAAVGRLNHRVLTRLNELLTELELAVTAAGAHVPAPTRQPVSPAPPLRAPSTVGSSGERRAAGVLGLFGGFGLARLGWGYRDALPPVLGMLAPAMAVGLGVTVCALVQRGRRASVQRAVLTRWTAEVLADLRGRLEAEVARRVLAAEHELGAALERVAAARASEADAGSRAEGRPAEVARDRAELERLRAACTELDRLIEQAVPELT